MVEFKQDIDIVLGSQYGDEGKGMVAKIWADAAEIRGEPYRWTSRTGAQNAEHRFIHTGNKNSASDFCARVLPSACAFRDEILAILGAGHCFIPDHLIKEATHLGINPERIFCDPHAMWLKPEHASSNLQIGNERGTTGWGIGQAIAEKVRRKPGTELIGDSDILQEWLGPNLCDVPTFLADEKGPGLMEGSQGAMLSLNHGHYPYCTAKDVTVPGMLAELGVNHWRVREVVGVVRLVMMRVPGPSGPTGAKELTYDEVEGRTALRLPHHTRLQGDTTRWKASSRPEQAEEERLFEVSLDELWKSHCLNGYTSLAVTFADFHRIGNYRATEWCHLHPDTKTAIEEMEKILNIPVTLIRTGRGERDNIFLRDGAS